MYAFHGWPARERLVDHVGPRASCLRVGLGLGNGAEHKAALTRACTQAGALADEVTGPVTDVSNMTIDEAWLSDALDQLAQASGH